MRHLPDRGWYKTIKCFNLKLFPDSLHPSRSPDAPQAKSSNVGHALASLGITNSKCCTQPLPSMDVYRHTKNQSEGTAPSRDISDQRFLLSDWPRAFCMKLGVHKRKKVTEPDFSGKLSFSKKNGKRAQKGLKIGFLDFCAKLSHYFFC